MAKWFGKIGYAVSVQTAPSVWKPQIKEYSYYGDIIRNTSSRHEATDSTNDELKFDAQISIVADQFAYQHFASMKWIELYGVKWKIAKVEPKHPRLILTVGGQFNG